MVLRMLEYAVGCAFRSTLRIEGVGALVRAPLPGQMRKGAANMGPALTPPHQFVAGSLPDVARLTLTGIPKSPYDLMGAARF